MISTVEDIRLILHFVTFEPSCVDMGWEWEVKQLYEPRGNYDFSYGGYLLRTTFSRPDRDTGVVEKGYGRWWHLPEDCTESAVVKTAYAAARMILEHELMESFRFQGTRIFDPHHDIDDLKVAAAHRKGKA